jgi:hypothetical protein
VRHVLSLGLPLFIALLSQPLLPLWQPSLGRVTSMIKCGAFNGAADLMNVLQSERLVGEKIFMPLGQLLV